MLDVRNLVPMDEAQANKLAEASAAKASELKAALAVIEARFAGNKRISFDTITKVLGESIAEYTLGADPSYWTNPAPVAVEAPVEPTVDATPDATDIPADDNAPKVGRKR
jgi:hypothetical protein